MEKFRHYFKLEIAFIVLFLAFGLAFITITPPGQNPDEANHFFRINQLASGQLFSSTEYYGDEKIIGGRIPTSIVLFFETAQTSFAPDDTHKFNRINYDQLTDYKLNDANKTLTRFAGSALYSPIPYIAAIPFAWIANALDATVFQLFFALRTISLLVMAGLIVLAIRITPIGKWIFFTVGLLPATVSQSAAISADGLVIAFCFLFIAFVLRYALSNQRVTIGSIIVLTALLSAICLSKVSYAPIALILLLIPVLNKQMRTRKNTLKLLPIIIIAALLSIGWLQATSYIDVNANPLSDVDKQTAYILHQPVTYAETLVRTFFSDDAFNVTSMFGNFGWSTAPLPDIFIALLGGSLVLATVVTSPREVRSFKMSRAQTLTYIGTLLGVCLIIVGAIATSLYIYFAAYMQPYAIGIQGRYFIPLLPLILLAFYGNRLRSQESAKHIIIGILLTSLVVGILSAYIRYYVNLPPVY